jgi:membrane protein
VVLVFLTWVVALALVAAAGVAVVHLNPGEDGVGVLWPLLLFAGLFVAFVPMYLVFPPGVSLREALPGAALAAAAWTISGALFRAYTRASTSVEFFNLVGAMTNAMVADRVIEPRT